MTETQEAQTKQEDERRSALSERYTFRRLRPEDAERVAEIEQICFPPNEACSRDMMLRRAAKAPEGFLLAISRKDGEIAGFLNGIATDEPVFRDEFFTDETLHRPDGRYVMLLGLDVLPAYRRQGLATEIMRRYLAAEREAGREAARLTCLDNKVEMYRHMGYVDLGLSASVWGGEPWHEMEYRFQNATSRYDRALAYATKMHEGQSRIGGLPYITHPVSVAEILAGKGYGDTYLMTALFHDLLEDTAAKEEEILAIGGPAVLEAVRLLTKKKGYVMEEYVAGIRKNPVAFAVKGADRLHNLRCALCTDEDFKRRYVLETVDWYMDFMPEIPAALKELIGSMEHPLADLSLLYEPVGAEELIYGV